MGNGSVKGVFTCVNPATEADALESVTPATAAEDPKGITPTTEAGALGGPAPDTEAEAPWGLNPATEADDEAFDPGPKPPRPPWMPTPRGPTSNAERRTPSRP